VIFNLPVPAASRKQQQEAAAGSSSSSRKQPCHGVLQLTYSSKCIATVLMIDIVSILDYSVVVVRKRGYQLAI
jgi:hypothetical protein